MNLNANKTCESFEIDDNKEIFDFYYSKETSDDNCDSKNRIINTRVLIA